MRYAFATIVVLLASVCANAQPQKARHAALAAKYAEVPEVKRYFDKAWQCPKGNCPTIALAKELKKLRMSAMYHCQVTWQKGNQKGVLCKKDIESTPATFRSTESRGARHGPSTNGSDKPASEVKQTIYICPDDTQVPKPEHCLVTPLKATVYVCQDGKVTGSPDDCVVQTTKKWWILAIIIIITGLCLFLGLVGWVYYRNKWVYCHNKLIDETAKVAQLRQEVEKKGSISLELQKKLEAMPTVSTTPLPAPPPDEYVETPSTAGTLVGVVRSPEAPPADEPAEAPKKEGTLLGIGSTVTASEQAEPISADASAKADAEVPKKGGTVFGVGGSPEPPEAEPTVAKTEEPAKALRKEEAMLGVGGPEAPQLPEPPTPASPREVPPKGGTIFQAGGAGEVPTPEQSSAEPPTGDEFDRYDSGLKQTYHGLPAAPPTPTTPADKPGDNSK